MARRLIGDQKHFWQARYYDFNVYTAKKRIEKLRYIHRNPVKRDLVEKPEDWEWSSFRHYATGEEGAVEIEVGVDGKKARADGDAAAVEIGRDVRHLWRRDGKTPPKQPRLGRGALTMVGCATHPPQKKNGLTILRQATSAALFACFLLQRRQGLMRVFCVLTLQVQLQGLL